MRKLLGAFALIITVVSGPVRAEDLSVYVGGVSKHFVTETNFNEQHRFLAVDYKGVYGAYFRNSFNEDTFALGYRAKFRISENFEAGLLFGASYGYRSCNSGFEGIYNQEIQVVDEDLNPIEGETSQYKRPGDFDDYLEDPDNFERDSRKICPGVVPMITYTRFPVEPTLMVVGEAAVLTARISF